MTTLLDKSCTDPAGQLANLLEVVAYAAKNAEDCSGEFHKRLVWAIGDTLELAARIASEIGNELDAAKRELAIRERGL